MVFNVPDPEKCNLKKRFVLYVVVDSASALRSVLSI